MAAKKGFSERAWEEIINGDITGNWIDGMIEAAKKWPDAPFADIGPLLEVMLKKGVTKEQLCRLARSIKYATVFDTVLLAAEEGLDAEQLDGVHEELLTSDPSGKDGRPGSWPLEPMSPSTPDTKPVDPNSPLLTLPKGYNFTFSMERSRLWLAHTSINASTVRGVDVPGGARFVDFNSLPNLRGIAISPDARRVAVSNHWGMVALHDSASGHELWRTPRTNKESHSLTYAPDGSMILNSGSETYVRRHDSNTGEELPPLDFGEGWLASDLAFSPDGETLAVLAVKVPGANHITYWDWRRGKELRRHPHRAGWISTIQFVPDGSGVLIGEFKGVSVWDVQSHARTSGLDTEPLKSVSLHPTGRLLALNTYEGAEIREFPSGKLLKKLDTKKMYPKHFAFSPDGRHVLLVAKPNSSLWDVDTLLGEH